MSGFRNGDRVDVTIKGVRVHSQDAWGEVVILDERGREFPMPPQAAITLVAPEGWPVAYGDLWHDRYGNYWFAVRRGPGVIEMRREDGPTETPQDLLDGFGPLTLVHRKAAPKEVPF